MKFYSIGNYVKVNSFKEVASAMKIDLCRYIVYEGNEYIYAWYRFNGKWYKEKYCAYHEVKDTDEDTKGMDAYLRFYQYCGRDEIERLKRILRPMEIWESEEQLHYSNPEFARTRIEKDIYVVDCNSSFTHGVMQLPDSFDILKEYMLELYNLKASAKTTRERSKYKNLQNFLIGYFARVQAFISLRSEIITNSNDNILTHIRNIKRIGGTVYISNTDSIFTDNIGMDYMSKYIGNGVGEFKLERTASKFIYLSSNAYQLDDKLTYSGLPYLERKHTDLFENRYARKSGQLIVPKDYIDIVSEKEYTKICSLGLGEIEVTVTDPLGEVLEIIKYDINGVKND